MNRKNVNKLLRGSIWVMFERVAMCIALNSNGKKEMFFVESQGRFKRVFLLNQ